MENQTVPVNQSVGETVIQTEQQSKKSNFLIILLSVLLFISLAIAGFFAFQTQRLVSELTTLRTQPNSVATSEPIATNTSMTLDPAVDWKTYRDEKNRFTFKYPKSSSLSEENNFFVVMINNVKITIDPEGAHQWGEGMSKEEIDKFYLKSFQYPDKPELMMYPDSAVLFYIKFDSVAEKRVHTKEIAIFDQIISTFRFIE